MNCENCDFNKNGKCTNKEVQTIRNDRVITDPKCEGCGMWKERK